METETFKQQQHDRIEEGKELKREDEVKDLSNIPSKNLPGAEHKSLFSKISDGISNVATTISEKVGLSEPVIEGHEDLDQNTRKQVKKINKEILQHAAEKGPEVEKVNDWEKNLPRHAKNEAEGLKNQAENFASKVSETLDDIKEDGNLSSATTIRPNREGPSPLDKINDQYDAAVSKAEKTVEQVTSTEPSKPSEGTSFSGKIHQISDTISHGIDNLKRRFSGDKSGDREEERNEDGTKTFKTVKDGFSESVDHLKHEKRVEELGGQEELSSKNPFQPLTSGSNENESESRTLGEKVRGGLNDASQKISSSVGEVGQKVKSVFVHKEATPQDKENAQQIA